MVFSMQELYWLLEFWLHIHNTPIMGIVLPQQFYNQKYFKAVSAYNFLVSSILHHLEHAVMKYKQL